MNQWSGVEWGGVGWMEGRGVKVALGFSNGFFVCEKW